MNYLQLNNFKKSVLLLLILKQTQLQGQVLVHEEPRHHPVYQNSKIRILNVLLPPGDTTLFHIHHTPSVFINFTNTATGSQLQGKAASNGRSAAGRMIFENLAPPAIRTHRVWNNDIDTFHVIDVELLYKDTGFVKSPLAIPDLQLEINTAWVRAYRLNLLKGKDFALHHEIQSFILVSYNTAAVHTNQNGKPRDQTLQPGSFFDMERGHAFSLSNRSDSTIQLVLLEFPGN